MGLFNFVKDAGEKTLRDAVTGQHDKDDQAKKVQETSEQNRYTGCR